MAHGYAGMAEFAFLQMGLTWVIGCIILFAGAYLMGSTKGGRAAAKYTAIMTWIFLVGFAAIAAFAFFTGDAQRFLQDFSYAVIIEMLLLSLGCVWIMWFMATQYSRGRIAIDERFGSKENYLRAKEAAKRASRGDFQQVAQTGVAAAPAGEAVPMPGTEAAAVVADVPAAPPAQVIDPVTGQPIPTQTTIDPITGQVVPAQAAAPIASAVDPVTGMPVAPIMLDPVTGQAVAAPAVDASAQTPVLDPVTGMPTVDPAAAATVQAPVQAVPVLDPVTGQPVPQAPAPVIDPATGQVIPAQAPSAPEAPAVSTIDPVTGQVVPAQETPIQATALDPATGQPVSAAPTAEAVAEVPAPVVDPAVQAAAAPAVEPTLGAEPAQPVDAAAQTSGQEMVTPLPLGPSAPNVMPESNEQWLQQLESAALEPHASESPTSATAAPASDTFAPAPAPAAAPHDPFAPSPATDPYTGQPLPAAAPAHDPFAPAPAIDPYTGQPIQPLVQGAPPAYPVAPAIDPYTGQPLPAAAPVHDPFAPAPAVDPYTGQPIPQAPPQFDPFVQPPVPPQPQQPPYGGGYPPPAAPGAPYGY